MYTVGVDCLQSRARWLGPARSAADSRIWQRKKGDRKGARDVACVCADGYSTQVNHMYPNSLSLSSHLPPAADRADPTAGYPARIMREQIEEAERAQRERIEQSCELNTPAIRIRAWERLHRLTLPRGSAHAVLDVVASATRLTLEQVREEQRRRSELAPSPQPVDSGVITTPTRAL